MVIKMFLLSSVAKIYTENQYKKLAIVKPELVETSYIRIANILKRGEDCAFEIKGSLPLDSIALFPLNVEIGYLLFILNTSPTQFNMFDGKMNVLTHIRLNKKKISSLKIPVVDEREQRYFVIARNLKEEARKMMTKSTKDSHMAEISYGVFANLCDSLAIELYFKDYLEEEGVEIFKYWKKTVDENLNIGDFDAFFRSLLEQTSELRNQLMKLRMIPQKLKR